ncbi:MAG: septum formation initiator family protein [Bacteroidetes bacterium]|uniref:Septum formation initiator family protein n=1 Tax=Candidatus Cryptobacteroides merdavium TaxID=2840769 RepID=A0A9D9ECG6_9BACT|nr:septum formation initiator family protein [Candidatus Cryptobacteroides merdavium]
MWSTSIFLLLMIFWPGNNVIRWVGARIEISRQEKQIREYNRQIRQMDERIRMLTSDRDTLEKFAREQFNFAEPGDDVYIIGD